MKAVPLRCESRGPKPAFIRAQRSPGACTHVTLVGPKLVLVVTDSVPAPPDQATLDLFLVPLAGVKLGQRPHRALYGIDVNSPGPPSRSWVLVEVGHREGPESWVHDVLGEELRGTSIRRVCAGAR